MVHSRDPAAITFNANKLRTENKSQMQLIDSCWTEKASMSAGEGAPAGWRRRQRARVAARRGRALAAAAIGFVHVGSWLRAGKKEEKRKRFASLGGGSHYNFTWKLTGPSFFGLLSFACNVAFRGLLQIRKLPVYLSFQLSRSR
jgi:hypothetical protein